MQGRSSADNFEMHAPVAHILAVDDDQRICELLKRFLSRKGYAVTLADGPLAARTLLDLFSFDLLILDVMMPVEDGFSLLKGLRQQLLETPVIVLTARGMTNERLQGLRLGADDYLSKPFEPEELALRIAAILKRTPPAQTAAHTINLSGQIFNLRQGELSRNGTRIHLTESEIRFLRTLAEKKNRPVSRLELAQLAGTGNERSVDVQITRLRRKLETDPAEPSHLKTVRGVGYILKTDT